MQTVVDHHVLLETEVTFRGCKCFVNIPATVRAYDCEFQRLVEFEPADLYRQGETYIWKTLSYKETYNLIKSQGLEEDIVDLSIDLPSSDGYVVGEYND